MIIEEKHECRHCGATYKIQYDEDEYVEPEYCPFCGSRDLEVYDQYDEDYNE